MHRWDVATRPFPCNLCDALVNRTTEVCHAVENLGCDFGFGDLTARVSCVQPGAYGGYVASDLGFYEGEIVVARPGLPSHPSILGDLHDVNLALLV